MLSHKVCDRIEPRSIAQIIGILSFLASLSPFCGFLPEGQVEVGSAFLIGSSSQSLSQILLSGKPYTK